MTAMIFKRMNRTDPEVIHVIVQANEGSAIPVNSCVQLDISTNVDGVKALQPNTGELFAFLGVTDQAISDQDYGLVQVYGYRATSIVFQTDTTQATGLVLAPTAGQYRFGTVASTMASNTTVTLQPIFAVLAESVNSSTASALVSAKIFLRGL
jgi:hypothetical protein